MVGVHFRRGRGGGAHLHARLRAQRGDGAVQSHMFLNAAAQMQIRLLHSVSLNGPLLRSFDPFLGLLQHLLLLLEYLRQRITAQVLRRQTRISTSHEANQSSGLRECTLSLAIAKAFSS